MANQIQIEITKNNLTKYKIISIFRHKKENKKEIKMEKIIFENYDNKTKEMVSQELDITNEPTIEEFLNKGNLNDYIVKVGDITADTLKCGYRVNINEEWKKHKHWAYVLVIGGKVVKCGDSTMTLKGRWGSYSAGTRENRDNGTCSTTNYFISEIIRTSHEMGYEVELHGYAIPEIRVDVDVFGEIDNCRGDFVSYFESKLIKKFVDNFGHKPVVGKNGLVK